MERIDLSAHGFYITPDIGFDWKTGSGRLFSYYTYGAAFVEVEIDTLTGDFHTRTADVVMDLGYSLNPAIDIGQVVFHIFLLQFIFIFMITRKCHQTFAFFTINSRFHWMDSPHCHICCLMYDIDWYGARIPILLLFG